MIISRTPLRMSFTGGGSDIPVFYRKFGGAVLSTSIDKYVYVTVNKKFNNGVRVGYSKNEEVSTVAEIEHPLVRAAMQHLKLDGGVEITTVADIPSKGTGLGSSSTFTVGLLHALSAYMGRYASSETLAQDSCLVEIDLCGEPIGKQDQYAAAFGGFNLIEFKEDETVVVSPVICERATRDKIERDLLVFYTGITRSASSLLKRQSDEMQKGQAQQDVMRKMVKLTYDLRDELHRNNVSTFGEILHESWLLKKSLTDGISTGAIDEMYATARRMGAVGGKILGAGAGGFLLLSAPPEKHDAIASALSELKRVQIGFEPLGSRIIFYH